MRNFTKLQFDHMDSRFARHIRRFVGECHVGDTNTDVVRSVLSRFNRKKLQSDASPAMRRELWEWVNYCHGANLIEYLVVMGKR